MQQTEDTAKGRKEREGKGRNKGKGNERGRKKIRNTDKRWMTKRAVKSCHNLIKLCDSLGLVTTIIITKLASEVPRNRRCDREVACGCALGGSAGVTGKLAESAQ